MNRPRLLAKTFREPPVWPSPVIWFSRRAMSWQDHKRPTIPRVRHNEPNLNRDKLMQNRSSIVASIAIALLTSHLFAAGEWPQFRGPTGQGISTATNVPVEWNALKNVAWKIDVPGSGWSSPVLSDDKIYLTTAMLPADAPPALGVFCYDAKTGKKLWGTEVFRPDPNAVRKMHHKNSPASATPIVTND